MKVILEFPNRKTSTLTVGRLCQQKSVIVRYGIR